MGLAAIMRSKTLQQSVLSDLLLWICLLYTSDAADE